MKSIFRLITRNTLYKAKPLATRTLESCKFGALEPLGNDTEPTKAHTSNFYVHSLSQQWTYYAHPCKNEQIEKPSKYRPRYDQ